LKSFSSVEYHTTGYSDLRDSFRKFISTVNLTSFKTEDWLFSKILLERYVNYEGLKELKIRFQEDCLYDELFVIKSFANLEYFDLSVDSSACNYEDKNNIRNLVTSLTNHTKLKHLSLDLVLSDIEIVNIANTLLTIPELESFNINYLYTTHDELNNDKSFLFSLLNKTKTLKELTISNGVSHHLRSGELQGSMKYYHAISLANGMRNQLTVEKLVFGRCHTSYEFIEFICSFLMNNTVLKELHFSWYYVYDNHLAPIVHLLEYNRNIRVLGIKMNEERENLRKTNALDHNY
jgi:hypothetical protein